MHCPHFEILKFGVYDYQARKSLPTHNEERLVTGYEFEFYTEDHPGGQYADGVLYPVRRGCCSLFKPGQRQKTCWNYKCYFLNIVTQDPELCHLLDHLPVFFSLWNMQAVVSLFHKILSVESRTSLAGRMEVQSYVYRILGALEQYVQPANTTDRNVLRHQETLLMADKYIREHIGEDLSLASLAKLCNLDPTYFHKLYTAAFGRTPAQRVLSQRILAAKKELIVGGTSLEELAAKCGFSSQTYFCYQFKKATGKTPREYRAEMLSR